MQRNTIGTTTTHDASQRHSPEQTHHHDEHDEDRDHTVVSFDGLMKISPDETGSDPYNRTGSFKRLVR